jgi:FixJ family two-component response regulator
VPGGLRAGAKHGQILQKQRKVVAVIDDDLPAREAQQSLLAAFGFDVELYASAEGLLTALPGSNATALVLDIQLRDLSGIELCRQLLADGAKIPTVFVSDTKDQVLRRQASELACCVAFLEKPFAPRQLIEAVTTAIGPNPFFEK